MFVELVLMIGEGGQGLLFEWFDFDYELVWSLCIEVLSCVMDKMNFCFGCNVVMVGLQMGGWFDCIGISIVFGCIFDVIEFFV